MYHILLKYLTWLQKRRINECNNLQMQWAALFKAGISLPAHGIYSRQVTVYDQTKAHNVREINVKKLRTSENIFNIIHNQNTSASISL